jgi:peptidoglycan/xylan/chitin deacetylase (PgdA/CDA1 family)
VILLTSLAHIGALRSRCGGSRLFSNMNRAARLVLTHPYFVRAAFSLTRDVAPIFMLHRFRDVEAGNAGHDPEVLRTNLSWLRSHKFSVLSLTELLDRLAEGAPMSRTVAFTVDDGYADFARVAAPVFSEFDCPVTVFLTSGFLDGRQWTWWDKVAAGLTALHREADVQATITALKLIPEAEKLDRIAKLLRESGVNLPPTPPSQFAPMSWDDVRRLVKSGITFGPHSVTHPVLSRTGDEQSQFEVEESWRRVRTEARDGAVPIFCYPNGMQADFTVREESAVALAGMRAAVSTRPGYASHRNFDPARPSERFRLPRFGYGDDHSSFVQVASGIERATEAFRAATGQGLLQVGESLQ